MTNGPFDAIDERVRRGWETLLARSRFAAAAREGRMTRAMYGAYLVETYHYTRHNARNQARVGERLAVPLPYLKFCFEHAAEEVGHERMALHDLRSLGIEVEEADLGEPLPRTEALIAYLYWVASSGDPLRRLGYSYWAESAYAWIGPLLNQVRTTLSLGPAQMTFFVAHAEIDQEHSAQVRRMLEQGCRTEQQWTAVAEVAEQSLAMTGDLMEGAYEEHERLVTGLPSRYGFLRALL